MKEFGQSTIRSVALLVAIALSSTMACTTTKIVQQEAPSEPDPGETAGSDAGSSALVPCNPGDKTLPNDAFVINADPSTLACNADSALVDDGAVAGVAWEGSATQTIDGREVAGCIGIRFGANITLTSVSMKLRPVAEACGHACTEGEAGCGQGRKAAIFAGKSRDTLAFIQQLPVNKPDFFEYRIVVNPQYGARYIAICREPTPATGDSLAIDSVYGFCN